ncbi:glycosyltransferase family 2 protein [Pseudotenacibaculum sp. MALMAid0570]|uniref:glycosyltransferase family 2 protein n=1 Tax=Pseudotenacibaculum sp. MALMAid0570 TaxID=3143938 RepID=UPI0032DF5D47
MTLSVVSTLYKSKNFLEEFIEVIEKSIEELAIEKYELVFVNDGSPDESVDYLLELQENNNRIKVIDLSRNFGHHYAIQAGLKYATGDYVFLIDNDLEVSPDVLLTFFQEIKDDENLDVVYGYQENRKGSFLEKYLGKLFWILINKLSDTKIPHNILTERLMTKKYVEALLSLNDANLFLGGMMHWVGFQQKGIPIKKRQRQGQSTYSFRKRAELMLQAITSFSGKPLVYLFYFGITISIFSVIFIVYLIVRKLIYMDEVQIGWTSLVAVSIFILGILSTFLGIIGIYLYKVFIQVQGRPNAIVKRVYEKK